MIIHKESNPGILQFLLIPVVVAIILIKNYLPEYTDVGICFLLCIALLSVFVKYSQPYVIDKNILYKTNYLIKVKSIAVSQIKSINIKGMKATVNASGQNNFDIRFMSVKYKKQFISGIQAVNSEINIVQN